MIRPLRTRHRATMMSLAVLLPAAFFLGLAVRPPLAPTSQGLPDEATPIALTGQRVWQKADLWTDVDVGTELWRREGELVLVLEPREVLRAPDLLLYWAPGSGSSEAVPNDALWLGRLHGTTRQEFLLPDPARSDDGRLLLFSLGHQAVVTHAALSAQGGSLGS